MPDSKFTLFFLFISAMITENLIFARATGIDEIVGRARNNAHIVIYSSIMFLVAFPSVLIINPIKNLWLTDYWQPLRGIVVAVVVSVCCLALNFIGKKYVINKRLGISTNTVVLLSFNCTTFAIVLFSIQVGKLGGSLIYCFGACVGVMISMLLLHSGKERLEISNVSRAFQGLPITLIYIGILSMAIYGLIGHKLLT